MSDSERTRRGPAAPTPAELAGDDAALDRALAAWTPMVPPAGFAERVVAARGSAVPGVRAPRRSRAVLAWVAAGIGVAAAGALLVASRLTAGEAPAAPVDVAVAVAVPPGDAAAPVWELPAHDREDGLLSLRPGESLTVHDAGGGGLDITLAFVDACGAEGGALDVGDAGFTAPQTTLGRRVATARFPSGIRHYRVRCRDGRVAGRGTVHIIDDALDRAPAVDHDQVTIEARGKARVTFVEKVPRIELRVPAGVDQVTLHGSRGSIGAPVDPARGVATFVGLEPGTYDIAEDGTRVGEVLIARDDMAPILQLAEVRDAPNHDVRIAGRIARGWTLAAAGNAIATEAQGRFRATVDLDGSRVVLVGQHPTLGTHYFVSAPITR